MAHTHPYHLAPHALTQEVWLQWGEWAAHGSHTPLSQALKDWTDQGHNLPQHSLTHLQKCAMHQRGGPVLRGLQLHGLVLTVDMLVEAIDRRLGTTMVHLIDSLPLEVLQKARCTGPQSCTIGVPSLLVLAHQPGLAQRLAERGVQEPEALTIFAHTYKHVRQADRKTTGGSSWPPVYPDIAPQDYLNAFAALGCDWHGQPATHKDHWALKRSWREVEFNFRSLPPWAPLELLGRGHVKVLHALWDRGASMQVPDPAAAAEQPTVLFYLLSTGPAVARTTEQREGWADLVRSMAEDPVLWRTPNAQGLRADEVWTQIKSQRRRAVDTEERQVVEPLIVAHALRQAMEADAAEVGPEPRRRPRL